MTPFSGDERHSNNMSNTPNTPAANNANETSTSAIFAEWNDSISTTPHFGEMSMSKTKQMTINGKQCAITLMVPYADLSITKPSNDIERLYHGGALNGLLQHSVSSGIRSGTITKSDVYLSDLKGRNEKPWSLPKEMKARIEAMIQKVAIDKTYGKKLIADAKELGYDFKATPERAAFEVAMDRLANI